MSQQSDVTTVPTGPFLYKRGPHASCPFPCITICPTGNAEPISAAYVRRAPFLLGLIAGNIALGGAWIQPTLCWFR